MIKESEKWKLIGFLYKRHKAGYEKEIEYLYKSKLISKTVNICL